MIAAGWVWGSLGVMQRNYDLQRTLDRKSQELQLAELEVRNLELEGRYYQTREYQELAVRQRLGLVNRGEHALILPPNSQAAKDADAQTRQTPTTSNEQPSNLQQWMEFLFGTNHRRLQ